MKFPVFPTSTIVLLALLLVLGSPHAASAEQLLDRVLVSIEGEPITQSELLRFAKANGMAIAVLSKEDPNYQSALQALVVNRLIDKEAESLGISVSNEEVDAYLAEIRRQNGMDEEEFKNVLQEKGMSWNGYLLQVRTDILKNRVVSARVRSKINVVDEDIARYLTSVPELKPSIGSKRVIQLALSPEREAAQEALGEIQAEQSARGTDFDPLRLLEVGGRDLGYVVTDELKDDIAEMLESTKDGAFSDLLLVDGVWVSYYIVGTITEDTPVDPVLNKEISAKVYERKFNERLKEFIDVELPARYHVEQL